MSTQTRKSKASRRHYSPSSRSRASITITDRAVGWIALTLAIVLLVFGVGIWNRVDLLMMYYRDIKGALIAHGVNPHPHLPNESP